jgi:hypothetical protein
VTSAYTWSQLDLFAPRAPAEEPLWWTYHFGAPDRQAAPFAHLIRWRGDPPETKARGSVVEGGERRARRSAGWETRIGTPEEWAPRIDALLEDGQPRTFNRIAVELIGATADVMYDSALDVALWSLVERERVAWACEEGAVFFVCADFVERGPA